MLVCNKEPNSGAAKDAFHEISISRQFNLDTTDLECSFTFLCCRVLAPISLISASLFFLFIMDSPHRYLSTSHFHLPEGPLAKLISLIERIRWLFRLLLHLKDILFPEINAVQVGMINGQDFISWLKLNQAQQLGISGFW